MLTTTDARDLGLEELTKPRPCRALIDSQWGKISYIDWCYSEAYRLGPHAKVACDNGDLVSIWIPAKDWRDK